jgi:hypothetical protein
MVGNSEVTLGRFLAESWIDVDKSLWLLKNSPTAISQETASRQEALRTIFPSLLDIFYHPIFDFFQENGLFNSHPCYQHVSGLC